MLYDDEGRAYVPVPLEMGMIFGIVLKDVAFQVERGPHERMMAYAITMPAIHVALDWVMSNYKINPRGNLPSR